MAQNYDALFLDFDGVLADTEPVHWACWREILEPLGIDLAWEWYAAHCIGLSERTMLERLAGLRTPPVSVDALFLHYPKKKELFSQKVALQPPVPEAIIHALRSVRAIKLAVITSSGRREVEPVLAGAGILDLLATVVYGGDVKRLKPAPDPYLLAAERTGAGKPLVLEDSAAGLASAKAAGFDAIKITSPAEVPAIILSFR
jgi:beta-phosphoglucomutase